MNIDWDKFKSLDYWLAGISGNIAITPIIEKNSQFFWFFLWLFAILFSIGVLMKISTLFLHINHPLNSKLNIWGDNILWIGIVGDGWFLLRQLGVGFLGARLWLLPMVLWFLILFFFIIRYFWLYFYLEYLYFKKNFYKPE